MLLFFVLCWFFFLGQCTLSPEAKQELQLENSIFDHRTVLFLTFTEILLRNYDPVVNTPIEINYQSSSLNACHCHVNPNSLHVPQYPLKTSTSSPHLSLYISMKLFELVKSCIKHVKNYFTVCRRWVDSCKRLLLFALICLSASCSKKVAQCRSMH